MLKRTLATFHISNVVLQQQYQECRYNKDSKLIISFLVVEQNNELLLKSHELRITGS